MTLELGRHREEHEVGDTAPLIKGLGRVKDRNDSPDPFLSPRGFSPQVRKACSLAGIGNGEKGVFLGLLRS